MKKERNGREEDTKALATTNRLPKRPEAKKLGKRQRKETVKYRRSENSASVKTRSVKTGSRNRGKA